MADGISTLSEFPNGEQTEVIFDTLYEDVFFDDEFDIDDIQTALDLDARPVFLEGIISHNQFLRDKSPTAHKSLPL